MRIIIEWSDGRVTNTNILDASKKDEVLNKLKQGYKADIVKTLEASEEVIFSNRKFRAAYKIDGSECYICPLKAKELTLSHIRSQRDEEFKKIGVPYKLSPELENILLSAETKNKLQELRDITEPLKTDKVISVDILDQININNINEVLSQV